MSSRSAGESASALLEAAVEVAKVAGEVALRHYRSGVTVEWKADGTPVTAGDRQAERAAREWIEARFPQDGILGEEEGEVRASAKRRWILDPIDGTKTFLRRVPLWGTLVAVAEGEKVLAGVAYFPATGEMLAAAPGQGCFLNGTRTQVSSQSTLSKAVVMATDERFLDNPTRGEAWRQMAARTFFSRTWGDCYGYLLVASGRAEAMVDSILSPWDAAALKPIIEEAGGVFTDWSGKATAFGGSAIATNAALSQEIRNALSC